MKKAKRSSRKVARQPAAARETEARPRLSRRRRFLFLSIPYLLFFLALVTIEAAARLFLPHVSPLEAFVRAPHQQMNFADRENVRVFEGDPLLFWRLKPNLDHVVWDFTMLSTNAQGIRHEGDIAARKPAGAFRIVCLGDSVTFGYRVPVVWPDKPKEYAPDWLPYPLLLEKSLRAANPGRQIEVVPLAVPGYTTHQALAWLRRDIEDLQPDVVTACFGWNDISLRLQPDREGMPTTWTHVAFRRLMSHSQALTHAALWLQEKRSKTGGSAAPVPPPTIPRVPQQEYVENQLEIARLARGVNASAVIIAPVYQDAAHEPAEAARIKGHRDALRAAATREAIPYLEIRELTEANYPANVSLFGEPIHPNHLGHRLMATELLKLFAAQNLLKGLTVPASL